MILKYFWKSILWSIVIITGSIISSSHSAQVYDFFLFNYIEPDKFIHSSSYFILSLFLIDGFSSLLSNKFTQVFSTLLIAIAFGGIMEIIQNIFLPYRTGDILDLIANATGIITGIMVFIIFRIIKNR